MAEEEVEVLQSIYGDELVVERDPTKNVSPIILSMKILPALQSQCRTGIYSVIELPVQSSSKNHNALQYPKISPKVHLRQQPGFDESCMSILRKNIQEYIEANSDMPILYDIFQMIQNFVESERNFPCTVCPICLDGFNAETVAFCALDCDHYIHRNCFVCYVNYTRNEIKRELSEWPEDMKSKVDQVLKCPVCRTPLSEQDLLTVGEESITLDEAIVDKGQFEFNWEEWQAKLEELQVVFERQKAKGGLIDPKKERKRNLVTDDTELKLFALLYKNGYCYSS
ncbi:unnamed protein product [Litomosoides sigmodontis]|uniref:RING-type domain-containing protein n=1 Tax=Litomosoides sigmodontis TaxID=42156 RepID=A0A3P6S7I7_LITSI|nr:unnamed protein product [Litomosoides sigmodontis]